MAIYPHMPILCVACAHARVARAIMRIWDWALGSHGAGDAGASSNFGLLGEQNSPKWEIPCLGRRWAAVQNLTPYSSFILGGEIRNRTNKQKHTNSNDVSTPCLSACVDTNRRHVHKKSAKFRRLHKTS